MCLVDSPSSAHTLQVVGIGDSNYGLSVSDLRRLQPYMSLSNPNWRCLALTRGGQTRNNKSHFVFSRLSTAWQNKANPMWMHQPAYICMPLDCTSAAASLKVIDHDLLHINFQTMHSAGIGESYSFLCLWLSCFVTRGLDVCR